MPSEFRARRASYSFYFAHRGFDIESCYLLTYAAGALDIG
jgi:hypothetical protein